MQSNQAAIRGASNNGDFSAQKVLQGLINKQFCGIRSCFYERQKYSWLFWLTEPDLAWELIEASKEFINLAWGFQLLLSCQMQLPESGFPFEVGNETMIKYAIRIILLCFEIFEIILS